MSASDKVGSVPPCGGACANPTAELVDGACVLHDSTLVMRVAFRALRDLHPTQRARVMAWFCRGCGGRLDATAACSTPACRSSAEGSSLKLSRAREANA